MDVDGKTQVMDFHNMIHYDWIFFVDIFYAYNVDTFSSVFVDTFSEASNPTPVHPE